MIYRPRPGQPVPVEKKPEGVKEMNFKEMKEVDFKEKAGWGWSHNFLNQKTWHPLSYNNQKLKWVKEQEFVQKEKLKEQRAKEFQEEQEFFKQTAELDGKQKEKVTLLQGVSFMYTRPPGYNPIADKPAPVKAAEPAPDAAADAKKRRIRDAFGHTVVTGEEVEALKNAPRLDTGAAAKAKPFGVEVRNVRCARCSAFGHQSGDRECPLRDAIVPSEVARQKREDPLTAMLASVPEEAPKWELKAKGEGVSPPRGGARADDPNQQMLPPDDYELQLTAEMMAREEEQVVDDDVLAQLSKKERKKLLKAYKGLEKKSAKKKRRKRKHRSSSSDSESESSSESSSSESERDEKRSRHKKSESRREKQKKHKKVKDDHYEGDASRQVKEERDGRRDRVAGDSDKKRHRDTEPQVERLDREVERSGSEGDRDYPRRSSGRDEKRDRSDDDAHYRKKPRDERDKRRESSGERGERRVRRRDDREFSRQDKRSRHRARD